MYLRVFFIVVVVNIWIYLFIRLYNLYFLKNILRKIPGAATICTYVIIPIYTPLTMVTISLTIVVAFALLSYWDF